MLKQYIPFGNGNIQDSVNVKSVQTGGAKESPCVSVPGRMLCDEMLRLCSYTDLLQVLDLLLTHLYNLVQVIAFFHVSVASSIKRGQIIYIIHRAAVRVKGICKCRILHSTQYKINRSPYF